MPDDLLPFDKLREPEYPELTPRKFLTPKARAELVLKQGGLCAKCGEKPRACEYDHIVELWAGGTSDPSNWQALCRSCHKGKSGEQAKHRAKMNRLRGKAGQVKRRKERGPLLKSRNTFLSPKDNRPSFEPRGVTGVGWPKRKIPSRPFGRSARVKPAR